MTTQKISKGRIGRFAALLVLSTTAALAAPPEWHERPERNRWIPTTLFAQGGSGEQQTSAYSVGAAWDWRWQRQLSFGVLTGYTEATVGRWGAERNKVIPGGASWFTQYGVTPVLRLFPTIGDRRWFTEIGIGANYITPVYHTTSKRFSTEFNFGDHFAIGRILGEQGQASVALRLEHFSNGGIDAPNPGENFGQVRYSYRF